MSEERHLDRIWTVLLNRLRPVGLGCPGVMLDFRTTKFDTKAKTLPYGLAWSDTTTPFATTLVWPIGGGTWTHTAGRGWKPTCGVDAQGPAIAIPLQRPERWQVLVDLDYAPTTIAETVRFALGYYTSSNHVGAYAELVDNTPFVSQLQAILNTNNGNDVFTARITGVAVPGAATRRLGVRCQNGTIEEWDFQTGTWRNYAGRQSAVAYTAAGLFLQFYKFASNALAPCYVAWLQLTYL